MTKATSMANESKDIDEEAISTNENEGNSGEKMEVTTEGEDEGEKAEEGDSAVSGGQKNGAEKTSPAKGEKATSTKTLDWPLRDIKEPHANDVLYGRGGGTNHHPGNKRYRKKVEDRKVDYVNSKRLDKPLVALEIIREWRAQDPPGRFLKMDEKTGLWHDVGDKKAREKTSQALREKAPLIRKQQEEEKVAQERIARGEEPEDEDMEAEEPKEKNGTNKTTRFAEGTNLEGKDVTKAVLARDHSLGREYLEPDGAVTIDGFSWQDPFRSGEEKDGPPRPAPSGVDRVSSHGSYGPQAAPPRDGSYGPPDYRTSSHGSGAPPPPPPPPPPPGGYGTPVTSSDQRHRYTSSGRYESWGAPPTTPPPSQGCYAYPPPPPPGAGPQGSWSRDHSLSQNPLAHTSVSQPAPYAAFDTRASSGPWGHPPPHAYPPPHVPPPPEGPPPYHYSGGPYPPPPPSSNHAPPTTVPPPPAPHTHHSQSAGHSHVPPHPSHAPPPAPHSHAQPHSHAPPPAPLHGHTPPPPLSHSHSTSSGHPPPLHSHTQHLHQPQGPVLPPPHSHVSPTHQPHGHAPPPAPSHGHMPPPASPHAASPAQTHGHVVPQQTNGHALHASPLQSHPATSHPHSHGPQPPHPRSPSMGHPPSPPYSVDPAVASTWSGQDQREIVKTWSSGSSAGEEYDRFKTTPTTSPRQAERQQALPRPDIVKRATSNQNETPETRPSLRGPSVKRAALNRDSSAASNRLKEQYLPGFKKNGTTTFDPDCEVRKLSDNLEQSTLEAKTISPKPLSEEEKKSTIDLIAMDLMVKPSPLVSSGRSQTLEALDLDLDLDGDPFIRPMPVERMSTMEQVLDELKAEFPKPGALSMDDRLTTNDFLAMVNEPVPDDDAELITGKSIAKKSELESTGSVEWIAGV